MSREKLKHLGLQLPLFPTTSVGSFPKPDYLARARADFAKGSPMIPMSFDDEIAKFLDCAAFAKWPAAKAKAVVEMVRKLEDVPDVRKLTALLG